MSGRVGEWVAGWQQQVQSRRPTQSVTFLSELIYSDPNGFEPRETYSGKLASTQARTGLIQLNVVCVVWCGSVQCSGMCSRMMRRVFSDLI